MHDMQPLGFPDTNLCVDAQRRSVVQSGPGSSADGHSLRGTGKPSAIGRFEAEGPSEYGSKMRRMDGIGWWLVGHQWDCSILYSIV